MTPHKLNKLLPLITGSYTSLSAYLGIDRKDLYQMRKGEQAIGAYEKRINKHVDELIEKLKQWRGQK